MTAMGLSDIMTLFYRQADGVKMNRDLEQKKSIRPFLDKFAEVLRQRVGDKKEPLFLMQGGYGKHNTGDDTLLRVAIEQVREIYPDARVVALAYNPEFLKESYGIEAIPFKLKRIIPILKSCDAQILASGGLVNDIDFDSYLKKLLTPRGKFVFLTVKYMLMRKKPTVVFGVGLHLIPNFLVRWLMKSTLPKVALLSVRDEYSIKVLNEIGVKDYFFHHDPALIFRKKYEQSKEDIREKYGIKRQRYIFFNFRYTKNEGDTRSAVRESVEYIRRVAEKYPDHDILMVPFSVHPTFELENDVIAHREIKQTAEKQHGVNNLVLVENYQTADEIKNIAEHSDLLILTRHHAPVLTYETGVPTVVVSYNLKCREFAELGGYKYVIDYEDITADALMKMTDEVLEGTKSSGDVKRWL